MKMFTRYREAEKKTGSILNVEWQAMRGGYLHIGKNNWTFLHRFASRGQAMFGTEQEFVMRAQVALDFEPRFSWITLEFVNPFEARLAYIWIKLWPGRNLKFVFNFGWRLTIAAKKTLQNQILEKERRDFVEMRRNAQAAQKNGGGHHAPIAR